VKKPDFPTIESFNAEPCIVYWWDAAGHAKDDVTEAELDDLANTHRVTFGHLVKRDRRGVWVAGTLDTDGISEVTFVARGMIHAIVMLAPSGEPPPKKKASKAKEPEP
jgi:hypothetical protein